MTGPARTLDDWLTHIEGVHSVGIDMGLERITRVAERMGFTAPDFRPAPRSVIVAGTNGKGSTCVALEGLLLAAGLRVGTTLSPHVHVFNERVRINGVALEDAPLCQAFAAVESARADVPLTYFEFAALAALYCFRSAAVNVAILEVGLGGRLDAFNLVGADLAVITSIGLDHQAWLGDDVESIGREKAGVLRLGRPVVLGATVSNSVLAAAADLSCPVRRLGEDFSVRDHDGHWAYCGAAGALDNLSWGPLAPDNCALALEAAVALNALPADPADVLAGAGLPGRLETWRLGSEPERLLVIDVAHNPAGAGFLRSLLERRYPGRRFVALAGMLADKDCSAVAAELTDFVHFWVCAPTVGPRGQSGPALAARVEAAAGGSGRVAAVGDVGIGLERALSLCGADDGILAFGSFSLVEQVRDLLASAPMDCRS